MEFLSGRRRRLQEDWAGAGSDDYRSDDKTFATLSILIVLPGIRKSRTSNLV